MIRNSLIISGKQKMSKKEQNRKIAAVRKQISDLKSRVTKLQSCLCTLQEDPDQYFQNLNTDNREYVDWKKRQNKSEKDEENISSNEKEEEECHATTTSTRAADTFGFFSVMIRFFHSSASSVPAWGASRSSSSSYGQTAPGYYSSYSHTSGGSVSFPSLGRIFSSIPCASPSDQSLSSSDDIYSSVQDSACSNTCLNTSNPNTSTLPCTFNTSSSHSSSTYTPPPPPHYTGCPCADCVKKYAY